MRFKSMFFCYGPARPRGKCTALYTVEALLTNNKENSPTETFFAYVRRSIID